MTDDGARGRLILATCVGSALFVGVGLVAAEGAGPSDADVGTGPSEALTETVEVTEETMGEEIYGRCLACHAIEYDRVGPRHCGLFGRPAGSVPDFGYSEAMRSSGIVWGPESLDRFLLDPMGVVPGTLMTYAGVPEARDRALLIAWLAQAAALEVCRSADP